MSSKNETACVYASLILVDDDIAITGEKIQTVLKAANLEVEPYWPGLFAKSLEGLNPKDLITNVGSGIGAAAPVAAGAAVAAAAPVAAEATKAEVKEESDVSDDDMGFGLFD